jgi:hypothetical protein
MFPTTIVKLVASTAVSIGVGKIVGNAIKASTPDNLKTYERICIRAGRYALSGACAAFAAKHIESQIDDLAEIINGTKKFGEVVKKAWVEDAEGKPDTAVEVNVTTTPRKDSDWVDATEEFLGHEKDAKEAADTEEFVDHSKTSRYNRFNTENQS